MSLRSSSAALLLAALAVGGCAKKAAPPGDKPGARPPTAQDDATRLGRDLFDVMDVVLSYRASHQGRLPQTLRQIGVDSLGKTTIRRLAIRGAVPEVTAVFRSTEGHQLSACHGTSDIQEEASLNSGSFTVACATVTRAPASFKVQGVR